MSGTEVRPTSVEPDFDWGSTAPEPSSTDEELAASWARRGEELLRRLEARGVVGHEVRADLRDGRFVWVDPLGRISAEARAQVLCSWSQATHVVAMGWADFLVRSAAIPRIAGMPDERDDVDQETAWRIAMRAADRSGAEYLHRIATPHAWYFLGLFRLAFPDGGETFLPRSPVGLVVQGVSEVRDAVEAGLEPASVLRNRLIGMGGALLHQAGYAYRGTDWVARLERTGRRLLSLAGSLPRSSFGAVAAGQCVDEWLPAEPARDLAAALRLMEEEWSLFA